MVRRISISVLLAIQAIGAGAVTLAHARDVVDAPPAVEASHDGSCAILHDEVRCALCHYAGARLIHQPILTVPALPAGIRGTLAPPQVSLAAVVRLTAPARAPPTVLS